MRGRVTRVHVLSEASGPQGPRRPHHPRPRDPTICIDALTGLSGAPTSVGRARRWSAQQLQLWFPRDDELAEDLTVVVSELVTNSVAAGAVTLSIALHAHARGLDVAVADDAPGLPLVGIAAIVDTRGRGLAIVQALSLSWEVVPYERGTGKTVWATLATHADGRLGFDCTVPAA